MPVIKGKMNTEKEIAIGNFVQKDTMNIIAWDGLKKILEHLIVCRRNHKCVL